MLVTLATFHFARSELKLLASENTAEISKREKSEIIEGEIKT
jgi:hypothetical protein